MPTGQNNGASRHAFATCTGVQVRQIPVPKGHRLGTDRLVPPDQTLASVRPHLSAMGITRVANVTGLDILGVPVVTACRPNSRSLAVTQGKGLTLAAAKASALMEACEAYHAENVTSPLVLGSLDDLREQLPVADPRHLPTGESGPFYSDRPLLWIEATDLSTGAAVWVPYDLVHTDFTYASRLGQGMFDVTSNGLASGNHLLEATSHALCEVIERDATALWKLLPDHARARTRVDLTTVDDPSCQTVLACLDANDIAVGVWETTSDVALPCFLCNIAEDPDLAVRPLYASEGMGCHPRREVALLRALTEAVQSRLTLIAGSRDDLTRTEYERLRDRQALELMWRAITQERGESDFHHVPTYDYASFADDVALEVDLLAAVGCDSALIVDLTKQALGIPVVRAVVPKLECYVASSRYVPGRRAKAALAEIG